MRALLSFWCFLASTLAQLPLPNPLFLPPNASFGAQPSSAGSPNPQWSTLLGNLLYFYEAQRSGKLPSTKRVFWRNDSALNDGRDAGLDLSGGYYDAGDFIKNTYTLSFSVMSICWGGIDFGKGYDLAKQTAYLDDMLRWGLDWLMKAHAKEHTLYVLVSDSNDHDSYWGGDSNIPTPRPSYQINDTAPGTDAAAAASAAFSSCSALYAGRSFNNSFSGPASLQNSSYASTLLTHGQQLYSFAANATGGRKMYQNSVPAVAASYASSSFNDELTLAALFLSWAENSTARYQEAEKLYQQFQLAGQNGVFNWDSKTPGLPVLFAQISQSSTGIGSNLSLWQTEAERYFDRIVNQQGSGHLTRGGLLYYDGDSDDASLNPALNAAMLLRRYSQMATSSYKKSLYQNFSHSQVDYVLGKNPMSGLVLLQMPLTEFWFPDHEYCAAPYIVGANPNSPSNPHSAMASGGNDIGKIDIDPAQEAYVLYGGVVGGPDKKDQFYNIRSDWPQTEIALDYNAPMLTLAAMHVLNDTMDPFYTSLQAGEYDKRRPKGQPCDKAFPKGCGGPQLSKGGKIAMGVILSMTGCVIIVLGAWYLIILFMGREGSLPESKA